MDARWAELADLLVARRVELARHANRSRFVRDRDLTKTQARIMADLETGARDNYDRGTLAFFEQVYEWTPGSIRDVLAGGKPTPVAKVSEPADDVLDDPVLFLLTQEEQRRLDRLPVGERRRVIDAMRASARATADALLRTGDEQ